MNRDPDALPVIYMDTSAYGRPFDNPLVGNNRREGRAVGRIVSAINDGAVRLVTSSVVEEECAQATTAVQELASALQVRAVTHVAVTPEIEALAVQLSEGAGLKLAESRHVACAVAGGAADFVSCNPKRLRKQPAIEAVLGRPFPMKSPPDFVREVLSPRP